MDSIIDDLKNIEEGDKIFIVNSSAYINLEFSVKVNNKSDELLWGVMKDLDSDDLQGIGRASRSYDAFQEYIDEGAEVSILKKDGTIIVNGKAANPITPTKTVATPITLPTTEILGIDFEHQQPIIIIGINQVSKIYTPKNEREYVYDYINVESGIGIDIPREEFFVTHDIITATFEYKIKSRDTLQILNIYRGDSNNVAILYKILAAESFDKQDVKYRIGLEEVVSYERFFKFYYNVKEQNFYNLHELLETPKLVPSVTQSDDFILQGYKDKIHEINKNIADALFLKSITSPIDFENKIELGQNITKMQKEVNNLNFKIVERRLSDLKLFDDLFEQSFTTIQNNYEDVYTNGESEYFAPDGARSELSNRLNELIRTPQFKEWFGDWELSYIYKDVDPFAIPCSKVLDNNYEPLLVWHGTGAEFSYFRFDNVPAAYFARKEAYSQWCANLQGGDKGYTIPFFLNMRTPLDLTRFGIKEVSSKDFFDYIFLETGMSMEYLEVNPMFFDSSIPPLPTWVFLRRNPAMLKKLAESSFDGIHFYEHNPNVEKGAEAYETEAFITFEPTQCKIADPKKGELLLSSLKSFLLKRGGKI
jgi:hypothetical protein